jgi:hypothetical protein
LREQKLLTVGAGENVVRFLPPLIVTEAEIEESVATARARLRGAFQRAVETGGGNEQSARHFLDLNEIDKELRTFVDSINFHFDVSFLSTSTFILFHKIPIFYYNIFSNFFNQYLYFPSILLPLPFLYTIYIINYSHCNTVRDPPHHTNT